MEKKITIGNVCFIRDPMTHRVLFLKRGREPMKGLYTGVGGKTEFCEDIRSSCFREACEETGLRIRDFNCKGVLKTILDGADSSWILFIYAADSFEGQLIDCDEGELRWVGPDEISSLPLIGFIRAILPAILFDDHFVEGTIRHDISGRVLEKTLNVDLCGELPKNN
jgi:8-oxo-dGTP diphosphatase